MILDANTLARKIDVVVLRPEYTAQQVKEICARAVEHNFALVSALSQWLPVVADCLQGTGVAPGAAIGFPLGASTAAKVAETKQALADGAREIDMVAQIGALVSGDLDFYRRDIEAVVATAQGKAPVKVIVETCYLSAEQKRQACQQVIAAGADFIKTSTGFGPAGAQVEDVRLFSQLAEGRIQVKASGGIKTLEQVQEFLTAGANRIGTSAGPQILAQLTAGEANNAD
ncbi:MAG: deoxyribose-phosphate aldolase [Firmicutes bacterium]|nr:deoxyribose-phosphate aldolase [Bacillota bacterium]